MGTKPPRLVEVGLLFLVENENSLTPKGKKTHLLQEQEDEKEGISGSLAISCFPLRTAFDIEEPGYTDSL